MNNLVLANIQVLFPRKGARKHKEFQTIIIHFLNSLIPQLNVNLHIFKKTKL